MSAVLFVVSGHSNLADETPLAKLKCTTTTTTTYTSTLYILAVDPLVYIVY